MAGACYQFLDIETNTPINEPLFQALLFVLESRFKVDPGFAQTWCARSSRRCLPR
jgi:hypothetical protein